jgi:hypothetical protein
MTVAHRAGHSHHDQDRPAADNVLALKPGHRVMIEQAAIRLPNEKQSAFLIARPASCSGGNSVPPAA